jgi:flagellar biosynthesis/type III secretory pathway M-ring protein FliF/YscJ
METKMYARGNNTQAGISTRSVWHWTPLVAVAAVVMIVAAILPSPAMRQRAEQLKAEQIDQENRSLCERLGMPRGSERFAACAGALSEARQAQAKRFAIEFADF